MHVSLCLEGCRKLGQALPSARFHELPVKVGANSGPLWGGNGVDASIAESAVFCELVGAEDAVELGAEALNSVTAGVIEEVRAELDSNAAQGVEGMREQQMFGLGVEGCTLHTRSVPGGADLYAAVGAIDLHIRGHADGLPCGGIENRERQHGTGAVQGETALDLGRHGLRRRNVGVPELMEVAVLYGERERVAVTRSKRHELDVLAEERDRGEDVGRHRVIMREYATARLDVRGGRSHGEGVYARLRPPPSGNRVNARHNRIRATVTK